MPITTNYSVRRGVALTIQATPPTPVNITGWSLQCNIGPASPAGAVTPVAPALVLDNGFNGGITVTNAATGAYTITLTSVQSLALSTIGIISACPYDVWRVDTGFEDELANGVITINPTPKW